MFISNKTEIQNDDSKGKSRFATDKIVENEIIIKFEGKTINHPTETSIQFDIDKHLERGQMTYINHSCKPNGYINYEDFTLRAVRPIQKGDEVTFNYNSTEYDMKEPFECRCGSENCLNIIKGFKHLSKEQQRNINPLAPYLEKTLNQV